VTAEASGERLQKVLAHVGIGSRRAVEEMISAGRIEVNGTVARLGQRVDPSKDVVKVDGSAVPLQEDLIHILLNKPVGVVSTASDPQGRETVLSLLDLEARVWPVGRLDIETEGAILLCNDGELTMRMTHPRYGMTKTYLAEVAGSVAPATARTLAKGVELDDGITAPARVQVIERTQARSLVELTLSEGRNRQVRRMFDEVGHPVVGLARIALGPLRLGRLKPGTYRKLGPAEVRALYRAAGL
jgi:23S rRNA pseudouridine2605 synthase